MKNAAAIRRATSQAHRRMVQLDAELLAELVSQYTDAREQVRAAIAQHLGPDDSVAREHLQGLLGQIDGIVQALGRARDAELLRGIERAAGLGVEPLSLQGLAGGGPGEPATYVGMCHVFCESVEAFQAGFGPHAKEIMADIPNYTDLTPVIQISEVVVGPP